MYKCICQSTIFPVKLKILRIQMWSCSFSQMFVWKTFSFLDLIVTDIFITSFKKTPNVKLYIYIQSLHPYNLKETSYGSFSMLRPYYGGSV